ncbi:MAG: gliding motility-associated C-terminal domain-containing protein [Bacteroidota bacterium]
MIQQPSFLKISRIATLISLFSLSCLAYTMASPTMDCSDLKTRVIIHQLPDCGQSNGSVSIEVTGGVGDIFYSWGEGNRMDDLPAMGYWVTVRDARGCEKMVDFDLKEQGCPTPCLLTAVSTITQPNCDDEGGEICLTISGAQGSVRYSWGESNCLKNLSAGVYIVQVSDDVCTLSLNFQLEKPTTFQCESVCTLEAMAVINRQPSCGGTDGAVCIETTGAQGSVRYSWGDRDCFDNLVPGRYEVIVSDNVCSKTVTFELGDPSCQPICNVTANATINRQPICLDGNDATGSVTVSATGGEAPYTFSWGPLTTYDNLTPGFYMVTATDAKGCRSVVSFNLDDPNCPSTCDLKTTVAYCQLPDCLQSNGSVHISVANNDNALSYQWSDGVVTDNPTRENLTATDYQVIVVEKGSDCRDTVDFSLTYRNCPPPCPLTKDVEIINADCNQDNGQIIFTIGNSTGTVTFTWADGLVTTNPIRSNLAAGEYGVTITDSEEPVCSLKMHLSIQTPFDCPDPVCFTSDFTVLSAPNCEAADGSVSIQHNAENPISYLWSDLIDTTMDSIRTGLAAGTYQVILQESNSDCTDTLTVTLEKNIAVNLAIVPDEVCTDSTGGVAYTIQGCAELPLNLQVFDGEGNVVATATIENDFSGRIEGLISDEDYRLVLTDSDGQEIQNQSFVLTAFEDFEVDAELSDECDPAGSIELTVDGGNENYRFVWADLAIDSIGGPIRNGLDSGEYSVVIQNLNTRCQLEETFVVEPTKGPSVELDREILACTNDSIQLAVINNKEGTDELTYDWNFGDQLQFNADDIANPLIFSDTAIRAVKVAVMVTNQFDCSTTEVLPIIIRNRPVMPNADFITASNCSNTEVTFENNNSDADLFVWDFGDATTDMDTSSQQNPTYTYPDTGTYEVLLQLRPDLRCSNRMDLEARKQVTVGASSLVSAFTFDDNNTCEKPDRLLFLNTSASANGDIDSVQWLLDGQILASTVDSLDVSLENLDSFEVSLQVFAAGCQSETTQAIVFREPTVDNRTATACANEQIALNELIDLGDGATITWEDNSSFDDPNNPVVSPTGNTTFTALVDNGTACTKVNLDLTVRDTNELAGINLTSTDDAVAVGASTELFLDSNLPDGYEITWLPDPSLENNGETATVEPTQRTTYTAVLAVTEVPTCTVERSLTINVGCSRDRIFFPNAFSPNGDNRNDVLFVRGAAGAESMRLIIYNRWGQKVFESTDVQQGWDGFFNGEMVCSDVYGYHLTVVCPSDTFVKQGNVTVLK